MHGETVKLLVISLWIRATNIICK